jgi:hypothetical protein
MNKLMGYDSIHVESVFLGATSAKCTFTPTDTISPKLSIVRGEDITFVRLNNLGQISHNGAIYSCSSSRTSRCLEGTRERARAVGHSRDTTPRVRL